MVQAVLRVPGGNLKGYHISGGLLVNHVIIGGGEEFEGYFCLDGWPGGLASGCYLGHMSCTAIPVVVSYD